MAKYFPVTKTKTIIVEVPVGDSGTVGSESLRYDLPEIHTTPTDTVGSVVSVTESTPTAVELGILAILLAAQETHTVPVEDVTGTEAIIVLSEEHQTPTDKIETTIQVLKEVTPTPEDVIALTTSVKESNPSGVEDVTGTETIFPVNEISAVEGEKCSINSVVTETTVTSTDLGRVEVDVSFLWPDTTVSNTGFTQPQNMTDKSTTTVAACSASSSGFAGTGGTQETTACNFVVSVLDPQLDDLTINSVTLSWFINAVATGTQLSAGQCIINYQYSINNGSSWTTFFAQTALLTSTSTLNLSSIVGNDWQKIKDMRFRAIGEVRSGTGVLSISTAAQWGYTRLRILASKDY